MNPIGRISRRAAWARSGPTARTARSCSTTRCPTTSSRTPRRCARGPRKRSPWRAARRQSARVAAAPNHIETFASPRYFPPAMNVIPQWLRDVFGKALGPVAQLLIRFHIRPNAITTVGTLLIVASAVAFALGRIHWAGFLLLVSGLFDMVDGRVAREGGMTTTFGAFYESTHDRVGESALFTGIGVYVLRGAVAPDRVMPAVLACFVGLAASLLVSYTRARAEGLGLSVKIGIAQREIGRASC